jgi:hypothetical protein
MAARELAEDAHEHERELARATRLHEEVRKHYEDVARFTTWLSAFVERTHPIMGPVAPVPAPPSDEEVLDLSARVAVVGSEEVVVALVEVVRAYQQFRFAANAVDDPAHGRGAREELDAAREAFRDAKTEADRQMRNEVRA